MKKIGRNQPCPCGSGKKHKHCCGGTSCSPTRSSNTATIPDLRSLIERQRAAELIRTRQQGEGKPIIAAKFKGHQFVAVKNELHYSEKWRTFSDFLGDYLKRILGEGWGNAQIAKPLCERHVILKWYDELCRYQRENIKVPGEIHSAELTGAAACYLGLSYSLYLLNHNVELQDRLVRRLKDPQNFQGAYYELIVANALIRSGFDLELEDETDPSTKHCEFAARSKSTNEKYTVEAKMRSVVGALGKTTLDGTSDSNPTSHLIPHLNAALAKPSLPKRLVFIDLSVPLLESEDISKPTWLDRVTARLERFEQRELATGTAAYVFVTNFPFHWMLTGRIASAVAPFGLGIPDFNKPGMCRLSEAYLRKQKHIDAYNLAEALVRYPHLPTTFDGALPSEAFGSDVKRVQIGQTYFFENIGERGLVGTVTTACVTEGEKAAFVGITADDGRAHILRYEMSDLEMQEYKLCPEAYFGAILHVSRETSDRYEQYESLIKAHERFSRENLLERMKAAPDIENLRAMPDLEVRAEYCERLVSILESMPSRPNAHDNPP